VLQALKPRKHVQVGAKTLADSRHHKVRVPDWDPQDLQATVHHYDPERLQVECNSGLHARR
jgi:hypothetical protein